MQKIFSALTFGGISLSPYAWAKTVDANVPVAAQACSSKVQDLPVQLSSPTVRYVGSKIWACGRVVSVQKWQCFNLDLKGAKTWTPSGLSNSDHLTGNAVWISDTIMVFCPNEVSLPASEYFDTANGWVVNQAAPNIPVSPYQTSGDACCLVVPTVAGSYLYAIGGRRPDFTNSGAVYAQRLLLPVTANSAWELLLSNLPQGLVNPSCNVNPTYNNHIFVSAQSNAGNFYVYDIYLNTFTQTTQGTAVSSDGIDFGEVCTDNKLYGVASGNLVYASTPAYSNAANTVTLLTGPGSWSAINGVAVPNRVGSSYLRILQSDLATAALIADGTCTGC